MQRRSGDRRMLVCLRKTAAIVVLAICLAGPFGIAIWQASHPTNSPQQSAAAEHSDHTNDDSKKETADEAIARYTWWLTIVTAILAATTVGLGAISVYQLKLARAEFIATHRPKITVHTAELRRDLSKASGMNAEEYFLGASLLGFNVGESAAKNVEVRGQIIAGSNFAIDVQRPIVETFSDVLSGIKLRAQIKSDIPITTAVMGRRAGIDYYCLGWIAYWDENGQRRETGFCFRADLWSPPSERWVSADKPEYEYEY